MADDGEWHTVTNSKTTVANNAATVTTSNANSQHSKSRRKSRHKIAPTTKQPQQKETNKEKKSSNPFHAVEEDESDEEEEDGQADPIDLPVPPYHTAIIISCPLEDCESPIPFLDTTSLVKHLKEEHKLLFKNLHHMYMALDSYLTRWAKELSKKPITEYGYIDPSEENGKYIVVAIIIFILLMLYIVYVIDPEKCSLDKEIREDMQRAKLVCKRVIETTKTNYKAYRTRY